MRAFCDLLAIELVSVQHFVTRARPLEVPADLLALTDDVQVSYEHSIGRQNGFGTTTAASYRDEIRATMARQAEGHFTLNEAAQVLADSRPGLDPKEAIKRFRLAHSKGELPIHQGGSRFPLEVGETVRDFLDTVEVAELDAWLLASVGYGFPPAKADAGGNGCDTAAVLKPSEQTEGDGSAGLPVDPMQRRAKLLEWFREAGGKRPAEGGKTGTRGALTRVVERSRIDKDTLGVMLDKAIQERRAADAFAQLNAKR